MSSTETGTVIPLLPQCSAESPTIEDFKQDEALAFQPNSWDYYKNVLPTTVPGIVLGCLCLLGFFFFLIWIIVQYCVCCCGRYRRRKTDSSAQDQFIKEEGSYGAAAFGLNQATNSKKFTWTKFLQICILLLTLATVACAAWGIAESVDNTDSQVSNFWTLVDSIDGKVNNTTEGLRLLGQELTAVQNSTSVLSNNSGEITAALNTLGYNTPEITQGLAALDDAKSVIQSTREGIQQGIDTIDQYMGETIDSFKGDYEKPSLKFQNTGRFIAIAILFSLTIIASLGAGLLSLRVNHPIWASAFVALLWFCVALLMLLGVGLLAGIKEVSGDACLYSETFALQYVANKVSDPLKKEWATNALKYYFDAAPVVEEAPGAALKEVTGVDIGPIFEVVNSPQITQLTSLVTGVNASILAAAGLPATTSAAVQDLAATLQPLTNNVVRLDREASRATVQPLYGQVKSLICCDFSSASDYLFIAWTAVGSLGFVLSVLTSIRIVWYTFKKNKKPGIL